MKSKIKRNFVFLYGKTRARGLRRRFTRDDDEMPLGDCQRSQVTIGKNSATDTDNNAHRTSASPACIPARAQFGLFLTMNTYQLAGMHSLLSQW